MSKRSYWAGLAFFVVATGYPVGGALAGQCLEDTREVNVDAKNAVRLRDFLCSNADGQPMVRVQFVRLNEIAAGVLLGGGKGPWPSRIWGKPKVIENEVLKEYQSLIKQFGDRT